MAKAKREIKYIFVFGGVLSGLGKGIIASSLGYLLKSKGFKVMVKWPNDIIFSNKKLGGILCENLGDFSVSGVGLNINNNTSYSDSINLYSRQTRFPISLFISSFLGYFDSIFDYSSNSITDEFERLDILVGEMVYWDGNEGIAESISDDGSLLVKSSGKYLNLYSEEVHLEKKIKFNGQVTISIQSSICPMIIRF